MWNYLEKAKALAETIDKQINDSVGIENAPAPGEASAAVVADLNDAWNDDFDDDDDLEPQQAPPAVKEEALSFHDGTTPPTANKTPIFSPEPVVAAIPPKPAVEPDESSPVAPVAMEPVIASIPPKRAEPVEPLVKANGPETFVNDGWANEEEELDLDDDDASPLEDVDMTTPRDTEAVEKSIPHEKLAELPSPPVLATPVETNEEHFQAPPPEEEPLVVGESAAPPPEPELVDSPITTESKELDGPEMKESPVIVEKGSPLPMEESVSDAPLASGWEEQEPYMEEEELVESAATKVMSEPPQLEPTITAPESTVKQTEPAVVEAPSPQQQQQQTDNEERILQLKEEHELAMAMLQSQVESLQAQLNEQNSQSVLVEEMQTQLRQREDQLASKAEQLSTMQAIHESEKEELRTKIRETKEEAKKRILRAKERVEDMEKRLRNASQASSEAGAQEEIIAALREEGEKLARKQSEMEKAVRAAKMETRELNASLQEETDKKTKALEKIASLEADLKKTKDELASARTGESRADKLEMDLAKAREESELKAAANLSLEQQVKELKGQNKEMMQELEAAKKGAALESARTSETIKKEHAEVIADLETKLRTSEREANVREDALRHEVAELRKRWQDAVRRADALSMDVQNSTAPLMRQLESTERQNRARAAAWAELETKLRSDLEEYVIQNEKLIKERNELRTNHSRLQRASKEMEEELKSTRAAIEEKTSKIQRLETKLLDMETEGQRMNEEWEEVERLANEGVARVRSDMMKTVVESEERYRSQVETMEKELREEREKRIGFERQLEELLESAGMASMAPNSAGTFVASEKREKKLKAATGQAEILASTLSGLDSDYEDEESLDDDDQPATSGGFAAMEQLTQRLKGSTLELEALRKQLSESEKTRENLLAELNETRQASEKLPLFETKVAELTEENREMELEIMGLQDDIAEVRHLYRTQLDALLEEKAAIPPEIKGQEMNGNGATRSSEPVPEIEEESVQDPSEQDS